MPEGLHILLVGDDPTETDSLVAEIRTLFEDCRTTSLTTAELDSDLSETEFDLALLCATDSDTDVDRTLERLRNKTVGRPVIVILPENSSHLAEHLSRLDNTFVLSRTGRYQNQVTVTIEEILRRPVETEAETAAGLSAFEGRTQAELIRTAAGTLAHEINNPLMAILGVAELILDGEKSPDPDVVRKVTMIRRSAERIETTLRRLADISEPVMRHTPSGAIVDSERSGHITTTSKTRSNR